MTDYTVEEFEAWTQYFNQQMAVPTRPGFNAFASFLAGYRADRQQDLARMARMREKVEQAISVYGTHHCRSKLTEALSETSEIQKWMDEQEAIAVKTAMELLLKHAEDHDWQIIAKNLGNAWLDVPREE